MQRNKKWACYAARASSSIAVALAVATMTRAQQQPESLPPYRYNIESRASRYARDTFGPHGARTRAPEIDVGRAGVSVGTRLDCGKLDVTADLKGEFNRIQEQLKALVPNPDNIDDLLGRMAILTTCYAYPTICAQLRHDFLSLQANLNLRTQACRAIDTYIDSQGDKGARQLRAEGQAQCVSEAVSAGKSQSAATLECQGKSGLPLRDFSSALEKRFTTERQKVLLALVRFARPADEGGSAREGTYPFLASLLGETEVQKDGYWQPVFEHGMLRPNDLANNFLAAAVDTVCGNSLRAILEHSPRPGGDADFLAASLAQTIRRKLTLEDVANLDDLSVEDRDLACAALGRSVGQSAAESAAAKAEAVLSSGLLNSAVPDGLRTEYRGRGEAAFRALRRTIESEEIPSVDDVRKAIAQLAHVTRGRNVQIARQLSESKLMNAREESLRRNDCTDTLSCARSGVSR